MAKYIHRAKTIPEIPMDYWERWDASTSDGMTFITDEDTGDVDLWYGQCGRSVVEDQDTGDYPVWTPGVVTFTKGQRCLRKTNQAEFEGASYTCFIVGSIASTNTTDNATLFRAPENNDRWSWDSTSGDIIALYNAGASFEVNPSNNQEDRTCVFTERVTYNGAANYDIVMGIGDTKLHDVAGVNLDAIAANGFTFGGSQSNGFTLDGTINEVIFYLRALSDVEMAQVTAYLSNKWSAQKSDTASADIELASTAATWTNNNIDKEGEGTANPPGKQTGEYSIVRVGDREALYLGNYIQDTFGSNLKYWFDAADTGHMTFATGDAKSGGTVSAWTDRTGTFTADTATSGDSAVDFFPSYRGRPCIKGGTSGTPKSLEESITGFSTTAGHERLFWFVCDFGQDVANETPALLTSGISSALGPLIWNSFNGDLPTNPVAAFVDSTASSETMPVSMVSPTENTHVFVFRTTTNGGSTECEGWYGGMKFVHYTDCAALASATLLLGIGATASSAFDSEGAVFELGAIDSGATAITDAQVDNVTRLLCEKYDVDYMPDTTPLDIGLHARSTSTVAQTDLCKWYRSDKNLSETAWQLHPLCAALYTAPAGYSMKQVTNPADVTVGGGRKESSTTATDQILLSGGYDYTETTDFPAMDGGATFGAVSFADSTLTTSSRAWSLGGVTSMMQWNSGGSLPAAIYVGNRSFPSLGDADAWNCFIGRHWFDDDGTGTPDGDPHTKWHKNDDTGSDDASTVTTFGTVKTAAHGEVTTTNAAANSRVREIWSWKHPLSDREVTNLQKYVAWRHPDMKTLLGL